MIELDDLHKTFTSGRGAKRKSVAALRGVSLRAPDGEITGFLGPNGAGKTTALRIAATLVRPDAGAARVDGYDSQSDAQAVRERLGVLSDSRGLYLRLTARENIRYHARLRGLPPAQIEAAIERLAALLDMQALLERPTEGFSQGERMKVAIARALVHDPRNLILDEPTNGLDIMSTRALRDVLRRLRDAGKCIVFSSHIMQEVAALCDQIVVIAGGVRVAAGNAEALLQSTGAANLEDAFVALTHPQRAARPVTP